MTYPTPATILNSRIATCYENYAPITPTDNTPIGPFAALWVGGAGTVAVVPRNSTTPVSFTVAANTLLPIAFQGINATGTTATGLVGLG